VDIEASYFYNTVQDCAFLLPSGVWGSKNRFGLYLEQADVHRWRGFFDRKVLCGIRMNMEIVDRELFRAGKFIRLTSLESSSLW